MENENNQQEIRTFHAELRADGDTAAIEGYAAVYNSVSEDLGGWKEVIEPGFFRDVLSNDVRALFNHDNNYVLGRTRSKTLELKDEEEGLRANMKAPDTQWANDLRTSMKRGDIDQMSFAFRVKSGGAVWEERPDGTFLRRLLPGGAERLYDVSVVTFPAYPQTSAFARSEFEEFRSKQALANKPGQAGNHPDPTPETTQEGGPGDADDQERDAQERILADLELKRRQLDLL